MSDNEITPLTHQDRRYIRRTFLALGLFWVLIAICIWRCST